MRGQAGFWDIDERYVRLSEAGDPLEKLNAVVPRRFQFQVRHPVYPGSPWERDMTSLRLKSVAAFAA